MEFSTLLLWKRGGVEANELDLRSEGQWFKAWFWLSCCFLGQENLLYNVSLHPSV